MRASALVEQQVGGDGGGLTWVVDPGLACGSARGPGQAVGRWQGVGGKTSCSARVACSRRKGRPDRR